MASFNEPAVTSQPADYTNNSQGPRSDTNDALGRLFKTGADIADAGIKEADRQKRVEITDDILAGVESVQDEFGVGSATDTEVDAEESPANPARPASLERAYENLDYLQNAYEKGGIKESHYWARLNVMVRQLRAKYPGYRQDIDSMVAGVVGAKPANALQSALFSEWNAAAQEKANSPLSKLEDWAVKDGTLPPDYFDRQQSGDPYTLTELQAHVANKTRLKAEASARQAEMTAKITERNFTGIEAERNFSVDSTQFVQTLLGDASKIVGKDFPSIQRNITAAQQKIAAGLPVNTAEISGLAGSLSQLRLEAEAGLNKMFSTSWDGDVGHSYDNFIDNDKKKAIIAEALAPIDLLLEHLNGTNNPYSVIGSQAAFIEASQNDASRKIIADMPMVANIGALNKLAGPDTTATLLQINSDVEDSLTKVLLDWSTTQGALGKGSVVDALDKGEASGQKADYYLQLADGWDKIAKMIDSGEVPLETIQNSVQYMFGQDSAAVLSKMDQNSRVMWYTKVASPEVTRRMLQLKKAGDEASWNTYQDWVKGAFVNIYAQEMNQLNSINEQLAGGLSTGGPFSGPGVAAAGSIYWDKDTSSFKVGLEWKRDILGINAALNNIMPGSPGAVTRNINQAIQVIKPIIMENGGDIQKELALIMAAMGFDGAQGIQGAMFQQLIGAVEPTGNEDK